MSKENSGDLPVSQPEPSEATPEKAEDQGQKGRLEAILKAKREKVQPFQSQAGKPYSKGHAKLKERVRRRP